MNKQARITEIVERLSGKPLPVGLDESLFESGVLDSFALTDMVGALEKEFSIRISENLPQDCPASRSPSAWTNRCLNRECSIHSPSPTWSARWKRNSPSAS